MKATRGKERAAEGGRRSLTAVCIPGKSVSTFARKSITCVRVSANYERILDSTGCRERLASRKAGAHAMRSCVPLPEAHEIPNPEVEPLSIRDGDASDAKKE
jgi:hypothetical protein